MRLVLCLSVFALPVVGAVAADRASAQPADKFAPTRDYSAENKRMVFGKKKKKSEPTGKTKDLGATDDAKKEAAESYKKMKSGSTTAVVIIAVIGVGLMLWVVLVVLKKFLPGGKGLFSTPAMEILGRTQFEQQKYMALVRVGKRVLVVGVAPGGFDSLTEITDEEEVADLLAIAKPKTATGKDIFHKMFQRQVEEADSSSGADGVADKNDNGAIADIQARVKSLREAE